MQKAPSAGKDSALAGIVGIGFDPLPTDENDGEDDIFPDMPSLESIHEMNVSSRQNNEQHNLQRALQGSPS